MTVKWQFSGGSAPHLPASPPTDEPTSTLDAGYKVLLTLGITVTAISIGAVVAKAVSWWYNKKQKEMVDDGEVHLDDHARKLVRARLGIMQFRRQRMGDQVRGKLWNSGNVLPESIE